MAVGVPYPKMVIRDRSLNRQTSDYTHAQIPYIKILAFPHFLRSIRFFRVVMLQTLFAISVSDAKPDPFGSKNRFIVSLSHLAVMSAYNSFLKTQGRFISVKHSNNVNGVKASFVHLT